MRAVNDLARALQGVHDLSDVLERICASVADSFGFERAVIFRYLEENDDIEPMAAHGLPLEELRRLPKEVRDKFFARRAVERKEFVFVEDATADPDAPSQVVEQFGIRSILALPLMNAGRCVGALSADHAGTRFTLSPEELALLETIGTLAAAFLEKAVRHDEMVRLDELKSDFIALASHELRTPVAVVAGIAATLHLRGAELSDDQLAALRAALHEHSERTRELVDQLLDLSRLEARSIEIRPERIRIRSRVEELVAFVAESRASDVTLEIAPELEAAVDPNALERVVSNLLLNALRHGQAPIVVAAELRDRHFRLAVEDRGRGVPPAFVPRLFDRFTRSARPADAPGGTGLGLSIAQSYAQAHGGEVRYRRATPRGACFELVLPVKPAAGR